MGLHKTCHFESDCPGARSIDSSRLTVRMKSTFHLHQNSQQLVMMIPADAAAAAAGAYSGAHACHQADCCDCYLEKLTQCSFQGYHFKATWLMETPAAWTSAALSADWRRAPARVSVLPRPTATTMPQHQGWCGAAHCCPLPQRTYLLSDISPTCITVVQKICIMAGAHCTECYAPILPTWVHHHFHSC